MWPDPVSNPGPLVLESDALPTALRGPADLRLSSVVVAGLRSAVGRAPESQVRGPVFDTRFGHILSFLLPLIQGGGQLSVTGESMFTKYWLTA